MERNNSDLSDTKLSYSIYELDAGLIEHIVPILDNIQMNWLHYQNHLMHSRPRGFKVNVDALADLSGTGKGGKGYDAKQVLEMIVERNIVPFRDQQKPGMGSQQTIFEEIEGGVGSGAVQHLNFIIQQIDMIRSVTGLNEVTDSSSPHPDTLKSVSEMAVQSSNNALHYISYADRKVLELIKQREARLLPEASKRGFSPGLASMLGINSVEFFKNNYVAQHDYKVWVEDGPTEEEKERFSRRIEIALQNGEIGISDAIAIEREDNIERAVLLFKLRSKQRQEQAMQAEQQKVQYNSQQQMESLSANHQFEMERLSAEHEMKKEYEQIAKDLELRNLEARERLMMLQRQQESVDKLDMQDEKFRDDLVLQERDHENKLKLEQVKQRNKPKTVANKTVANKT